MVIEKQKTLRRDIWQEDLDRISLELSAKGFDIRRVKTLRRGIRRGGQTEQSFYRVFFEKKADEQPTLEKQESDEREVVGTR